LLTQLEEEMTTMIWTFNPLKLKII
jgi:hypothetical protein